MKRLYAKLTLILCLSSIIMLIGCKSRVGSYPAALAWNNFSYLPSITEVSKDELGKQLGEIKRKKEPMPTENGDANDIPVGSKVFEIKGIDTKVAIAVEKDGKFYKAIKNGPLK